MEREAFCQWEHLPKPVRQFRSCFYEKFQQLLAIHKVTLWLPPWRTWLDVVTVRLVFSLATLCVDQGFPVIFHGVMGKDEREANSPSFFNVSEVEVLISYLKKLLLSHGKKGIPKLSATDIGIIAPYRKQVRILV